MEICAVIILSFFYTSSFLLTGCRNTPSTPSAPTLALFRWPNPTSSSTSEGHQANLVKRKLHLSGWFISFRLLVGNAKSPGPPRTDDYDDDDVRIASSH